MKADGLPCNLRKFLQGYCGALEPRWASEEAQHLPEISLLYPCQDDYSSAGNIPGEMWSGYQLVMDFSAQHRALVSATPCDAGLPDTHPRTPAPLCLHPFRLPLVCLKPVHSLRLPSRGPLLYLFLLWKSI